MKLKFNKIAKIMVDTRYGTDRRFKVDTYVAEYIGDDGEMYRKSFSIRSGADRPIIPAMGDHKLLNGLSDQRETVVFSGDFVEFEEIELQIENLN